jgi:hypothetical protein
MLLLLLGEVSVGDGCDEDEKKKRKHRTTSSTHQPGIRSKIEALKLSAFQTALFIYATAECGGIKH